MAATFVVEDGTGLSAANSYLSVADADQYNDDHNEDVLWVDSKASGNLHLAVQPSDGDTVLVDAKTFTFQTTLTDVDGNIKIGSTLAFTQANFRAAVNNDIDLAEDDSSIADATTIHPTVTTTGITSNNVALEAITPGIAGNSIVTTSVFASELNHFEAATLLGASAAKEKALRLATQYIDNVYGSNWRGRQKIQEQALDWPRQEARDDDDFFRDSDSVPQEVKDATFEAAIRSLSGALQPDITTPGTIKRTKDKVDVLEQEIEYFGGGSQTVEFTVIDDILEPLLIPAGRIFRT